MFVEHSGIWSGCFGEGLGGDWESVSVSERKTGIEVVRFRPLCETQRENFRERDPGDFPERESGSAVCAVPGGVDCLDSESEFYRLLHGEASGSGTRAGDQDQDAREAGG